MHVDLIEQSTQCLVVEAITENGRGPAAGNPLSIVEVAHQVTRKQA